MVKNSLALKIFFILSFAVGAPAWPQSGNEISRAPCVVQDLGMRFENFVLLQGALLRTDPHEFLPDQLADYALSCQRQRTLEHLRQGGLATRPPSCAIRCSEPRPNIALPVIRLVSGTEGELCRQGFTRQSAVRVVQGCAPREYQIQLADFSDDSSVSGSRILQALKQSYLQALKLSVATRPQDMIDRKLYFYNFENSKFEPRTYSLRTAIHGYDAVNPFDSHDGSRENREWFNSEINIDQPNGAPVATPTDRARGNPRRRPVVAQSGILQCATHIPIEVIPGCGPSVQSRAFRVRAMEEQPMVAADPVQVSSQVLISRDVSALIAEEPLPHTQESRRTPLFAEEDEAYFAIGRSSRTFEQYRTRIRQFCMDHQDYDNCEFWNYNRNPSGYCVGSHRTESICRRHRFTTDQSNFCNEEPTDPQCQATRNPESYCGEGGEGSRNSSSACDGYLHDLDPAAFCDRRPYSYRCSNDRQALDALRRGPSFFRSLCESRSWFRDLYCNSESPFTQRFFRSYASEIARDGTPPERAPGDRPPNLTDLAELIANQWDGRVSHDPRNPYPASFFDLVTRTELLCRAAAPACEGIWIVRMSPASAAPGTPVTEVRQKLSDVIIAIRRVYPRAP